MRVLDVENYIENRNYGSSILLTRVDTLNEFTILNFSLNRVIINNSVVLKIYWLLYREYCGTTIHHYIPLFVERLKTLVDHMFKILIYKFKKILLIFPKFNDYLNYKMILKILKKLLKHDIACTY